MRELGGSPRSPGSGFVADDGLAIVDVAGLDLGDPERLEAELDAIPGVVECGIFARRRADVGRCSSRATRSWWARRT